MKRLKDLWYDVLTFLTILGMAIGGVVLLCIPLLMAAAPYVIVILAIKVIFFGGL